MLLELLGSSAFGMISGFIGNIINSYASYKLQKLKNEHEITKRELDIKTIKAESDAAVRIEDTKISGGIAVAELEAMKESYREANTTLFDKDYMTKLANIRYIGPVAIFIISLAFAFVDIIKHSVRPILTYYSIGAATFATYLCWRVLQLSGMSLLTAAQAMNLFQLAIMFIFYMTSTIVGWWFADRRLTKAMDRISGRLSSNNSPLQFIKK